MAQTNHEKIQSTTIKTNNPLLMPMDEFEGAIPFPKIKNEHFLPALKTAIDLAKERIAKIKSNPAPATIDNTLLAYETCSEELDLISSLFSNLKQANGDEEIYKIAKEFYPVASAFASDLSLDEDLFKRIKSLHDQKTSLKLTPELSRLLDKIYKSFMRNGALLDENGKKRIRAIDQEFAQLIPKYSENVLKSTNAFEMIVTDKADVEGLPESALAEAAEEAEIKGHKGAWLFTLKAPSLTAYLSFGKNRQLRQKIWTAYNSRSFGDAFDNQDILKKIIELRYERAKLLGFNTHADFVLDERMAKTTDTVNNFLQKLLSTAKPAAKKDLLEIQNFAKSLDNIENLKPWDLGYYSEKLKEKKFAFSQEELRPYFQLDRVVEGVFEHARRLYGLQFKKSNRVPVYHEEVTAYEVTDEKTGEFVSLFYTDFFPRDTKQSGAWMTSYRDQGLLNGQIRRPHISIVCNFTRPSSQKPSLLTIVEVGTLFHEFGHALHGMLSQCHYRSLSGTNVLWDFVELPSQIMENWVHEKEGLDLFAKHFQTNELIPETLVKKLKDADNFMSGWNTLRQVQFAVMDMKWHTTDPATILNIDHFEETATAETRLFEKIPGTNASCSFSHIFAGGYSAGYYSYKWAEVLDADAFELFKEKGLFNTEVATRFKENILSRGDSEHPSELYKKFRGRDPDANALLRRSGLI